MSNKKIYYDGLGNVQKILYYHYDKKPSLAVKSTSFRLLEAFKKECEDMGWKYNHDFLKFNQAQFGHTGLLYFSDGFAEYKGQPAFSLSATTGEKVDLNSDYEFAVARARDLLEHIETNNLKIEADLHCQVNAKYDLKNKNTVKLVIGSDATVYPIDLCKLKDLVKEIEKLNDKYC